MAISVSNSVGFRGVPEVNTADGASLISARSPRYARDDNGTTTARPGLCYGRAIGPFEIASHAFAMTAGLSLRAAGAAVRHWLTQTTIFHPDHWITFAMTAGLSLRAAGAAVLLWLTQAAVFHLHHCAALAAGKI